MSFEYIFITSMFLYGVVHPGGVVHPDETPVVPSGGVSDIVFVPF